MDQDKPLFTEGSRSQAPHGIKDSTDEERAARRTAISARVQSSRAAHRNRRTRQQAESESYISPEIAKLLLRYNNNRWVYSFDRRRPTIYPLVVDRLKLWQDEQNINEDFRLAVLRLLARDYPDIAAKVLTEGTHEASGPPKTTRDTSAEEAYNRLIARLSLNSLILALRQGTDKAEPDTGHLALLRLLARHYPHIVAEALAERTGGTSGNRTPRTTRDTWEREDYDRLIARLTTASSLILALIRGTDKAGTDTDEPSSDEKKAKGN